MPPPWAEVPWAEVPWAQAAWAQAAWAQAQREFVAEVQVAPAVAPVVAPVVQVAQVELQAVDSTASLLKAQLQ